MQQDTQNKLGSMPMGRLLVSMSLPMMVSFFIQALYNIVDSMFVALISENALSAVSLSFPVSQVLVALGVGTGVGTNALIPRFMGRGEGDKAGRVAGSALFLCVMYTLVVVVLGFVFPEPFYAMQTSEEEIVRDGVAYLRVLLLVPCGVFFGQIFEKLLISSGYSLLAMASQATGAVCNLILDPVLMFGCGMGITGAALATVIGQVLAAEVALVLNLKKNKAIHLRLSLIKPNGMVGAIYKVGFPSMITIGLSSAMSFCVNQILLLYSTTATAVFGVWMKLQNFCFMPVFGMNNGMVPILAYNQGSGRIDRVKEAIGLALRSILCLMLVLCVVFELIPSLVLAMFSASEMMMGIGVPALRFCCLSLPFGGLCVILASAMQALGYSRYTLLINVLRQFVVMAGLFFLLHVLFHSLTLLWPAVPLTELVVFCLALRLYRNMAAKLGF